MFRYFLLLFLSFSICSCASGDKSKLVVTKIEYRKGDDVFKSKPKLFTREMCGTDDVRVKIGITNSQIEQIGDIAERSGFFDLSREVTWPQTKCLDIGPDSSITIIRGNQRNTMQWASYCDDRTFPAQLSATLQSLDNLIYNDPKVKNRPLANCPKL